MTAASSFAPWPSYARVPSFVPLCLRARTDGWTPARQGAFVGHLAATGCFAEAARRTGMSRMAAWRLRRAASGTSLGHAIEVVLAVRGGKRPGERDFPRWKVTAEERAERALERPVFVTMRRGRFARAQRRDCVISLIRHANRLAMLASRNDWLAEMAEPPGDPTGRKSACTFTPVSCQLPPRERATPARHCSVVSST